MGATSPLGDACDPPNHTPEAIRVTLSPIQETMVVVQSPLQYHVAHNLQLLGVTRVIGEKNFLIFVLVYFRPIQCAVKISPASIVDVY